MKKLCAVLCAFALLMTTVPHVQAISIEEFGARTMLQKQLIDRLIPNDSTIDSREVYAAMEEKLQEMEEALRGAEEASKDKADMEMVGVLTTLMGAAAAISTGIIGQSISTALPPETPDSDSGVPLTAQLLKTIQDSMEELLALMKENEDGTQMNKAIEQISEHLQLSAEELQPGTADSSKIMANMVDVLVMLFQYMNALPRDTAADTTMSNQALCGNEGAAQGQMALTVAVPAVIDILITAVLPFMAAADNPERMAASLRNGQGEATASVLQQVMNAVTEGHRKLVEGLSQTGGAGELAAPYVGAGLVPLDEINQTNLDCLEEVNRLKASLAGSIYTKEDTDSDSGPIILSAGLGLAAGMVVMALIAHKKKKAAAEV